MCIRDRLNVERLRGHYGANMLIQYGFFQVPAIAPQFHIAGSGIAQGAGTSRRPVKTWHNNGAGDAPTFSAWDNSAAFAKERRMHGQDTERKEQVRVNTDYYVPRLPFALLPHVNNDPQLFHSIESAGFTNWIASHEGYLGAAWSMPARHRDAGTDSLFYGSDDGPYNNSSFFRFKNVNEPPVHQGEGGRTSSFFATLEYPSSGNLRGLGGNLYSPSYLHLPVPSIGSQLSLQSPNTEIALVIAFTDYTFALDSAEDQKAKDRWRYIDYHLTASFGVY